MWLHLGGSYWQRASVDAVIVIAAFLALLGLAPSLDHLRSRHRWALVVLLLAIAAFGTVLVIAGRVVGKVEGPRLRELEIPLPACRLAWTTGQVDGRGETFNG
jgi:hypothetical protein